MTISLAMLAETEHYARRCINSITSLVPMSSCAFYQVDGELRPHDWLLHQVAGHLHQHYLNQYQDLDPLHPTKFGSDQCAVVPMDEALPLNERINSPYGDFMSRNAIADVVELFMRSQGRIVAGFSLLRSEELGGFHTRDLQTLGHLHGLLELAAEHALPALQTEEVGGALARLTPREREVALMLRNGESNKTIALQFGVGLSTVKTHLLQMFRKLNVVNRTEFVYQVFLNS